MTKWISSFRFLEMRETKRHEWVKSFGGMTCDQTKKVRQPDDENSLLTRRIAEFEQANHELNSALFSMFDSAV